MIYVHPVHVSQVHLVFVFWGGFFVFKDAGVFRHIKHNEWKEKNAGAY